MNRRRFYRSTRGNLAELPMGMLIFFMFIVFPFLNLMFYSAAVATAAFITTQAAGAAAGSGDYNSALAAMQTTTVQLTNTGWGKFARLYASGGYQNCGADLYVVKTGLVNNNISYYGPNTPDPAPPDPNNFIYEYRVRTNFNIAPFMNLACVPFISAVPMIGTSAPLSWCVERSVEYTVQTANGTPIAPPPGGTPLAPPPGGGFTPGQPLLLRSPVPGSGAPGSGNPGTPVKPFGGSGAFSRFQ